MGRLSEAPRTIAYLEGDPNGRTWDEVADHFNIGRMAVYARVRAAREHLIRVGANVTIPRPTPGTGHRFTVTDKALGYVNETSIARSTSADLGPLITVLGRLVGDGYVMWDNIPVGSRRTKPAQAIRSFIGAMENAAQVCERERGVLEDALAKLP
jgi:hypothetical protein